MPPERANEEADVRVAPALVRPMLVDLAAAFPREVADRSDRVGELPPERAGGPVDHPDERLEAPPDVARDVGGHDPQVAGLVEARAPDEAPLGGRPDAPAEAQGSGPGAGDPRRGGVPGRAPRHDAGRKAEGSRERGEGCEREAHESLC